ncbi:carbamate kinase [Oribacterium sinus]|jgi:carbamate kinase|uniref:Carbamate kinase n=1 Tax=Oribacterium sinus TaxID=237576 RepID=A0A7W9SHN3_9FIRM|nr:carbamate kinase [Oribacterium sinus]MBB6042338.1 carbamate kinase [Oribacterium sinus]MBF1304893.1 carbamate kinase [Oribacterium sinus]
MGKKIVIALGGNALGNNLPEQMVAVKTTAKAIVDLVEDGNEVVVVHGNGPQVGVINNAMGEFASEHKEDPTPLSVCVAMSQAYIGYDIQNALREEFLNRGGKVPPVVTVVTQVRVDKDDPAFQNPTKPIGRFMTKEEAEAEAQKRGWNIKEDAGRGYRRVVASPKPKEIVELSAIKAMSDAGELVICCGGGGIPVVSEGKHLAGAAAVIDKDFAAALLAESLEADMLIILTAVEKVAIRYGKPDQEWLTDLSVEEAQKYADQGEFAPGSMLPKVQAAIQFASAKKGNEAMITLLEKAREALQGKTGTKITKK